MLRFENNNPFVEDVALHDVNNVCKTPFYIYSQSIIINKVKELKSILENSGDLFPSRYQEMLLSVLELDKISIDEVMIPKNDVIGIDLSKDINEIKSFLESSKKEFFPIFDQNLDDIKLSLIHI